VRDRGLKSGTWARGERPEPRGAWRLSKAAMLINQVKGLMKENLVSEYLDTTSTITQVKLSSSIIVSFNVELVPAMPLHLALRRFGIMISRGTAVPRNVAACFSPVSRQLLRRRYHLSSALQQSPQSITTEPQSPYIPAPSEKSGPLLYRRPDRELPSIESSHTWLKTLPIFIALITVSALAIFNYQDSSSSTVNSILYALRTNDESRQILGDEIYFASKVPWISGSLNQLHGKIDISFWVKGTKGKGKVKFVSVRKRRDGFVSERSEDADFMLMDLIVRNVRVEPADRRWKGHSTA
jgi:cytochrome c oxidase assembly factor 1